MGQTQLCANSHTETGVIVPEVVTAHSLGGSPHYSGFCGSFQFCGNADDEAIPPLEHEHVNVPTECCLQSPRDVAQQVITATSRKALGGPGPGGVLSRTKLLQPHQHHRFHDYYEIGKKLGEGSFGDVYEARLRPVDRVTGRPIHKAKEGDIAGGGSNSSTTAKPPSGGRKVAVKVFNISQCRENASPRSRSEDTKKQLSFEAERCMLATLAHPHIVTMYECFQEKDRLYIVLEMCRGGELYGRLVSLSRQAGGGGLDEPLAREVFRQMLQAVSYLHTRNIVHRDIKTENFLLMGERGSPTGDVLKLCDFGTATVITKENPRQMESIGTLSYTAPEIYCNRGATVASDAWSLGVVLYVLVTGTNPFRIPGKSSREDTVKRIKAGSFETKRSAWQQLSTLSQDLVRRLLVLDENQRLTCLQALKHPWLASPQRPMLAMGLADPPGVGLHAPKLLELLLRMPKLQEPQRLALAVCALAATEGDTENPPVPWRELFLALDEDQDGRLSYAELASGLKRLTTKSALQEERIEEAAMALDLDQSGFIEWTEFLVPALLGSAAISESPEPLATAFRLLDRDTHPTEIPDFDIAAGDPKSVAQIILGFVPENCREGSATGETTADTSVRSKLAMADLRFVLHTTDPFEML